MKKSVNVLICAKNVIAGKDMELKENVLVGTINRGGRIIIPGGSDVIQPGDTVIVVTTIKGLNALEDILR